MEEKILLGSHVGMSGKEMFAGSVKEAVSYGANTFMIYTGAPQNTKRKDISELNLEAGFKLMAENGIEEVVIHAPYIINLANTVKPETYKLAVEVLLAELERTAAIRSRTLVLHPGSHVNAGTEAGINKIIEGLNEVLTADTTVNIALETMAGKGSEIGGSFEELRQIFEGVKYNEKLRVCFDTCHVNDAGYDLVNDYDGVMAEFDRIIGRDKIAVIHLNDSRNPRGSHKDRHENIGFGEIGFDTLNKITRDNEFIKIPKILETPYVTGEDGKTKEFAPYAYEIAMLRKGVFDPGLIEKIRSGYGI